jgi:hypothetical protein
MQSAPWKIRRYLDYSRKRREWKKAVWNLKDNEVY